MSDLISRQAAMDCFKKWQPYMATRLHEFEKELSELPSVAIPTSPCDLCKYNPPSSSDGKPCTMCPAVKID